MNPYKQFVRLLGRGISPWLDLLLHSITQTEKTRAYIHAPRDSNPRALCSSGRKSNSNSVRVESLRFCAFCLHPYHYWAEAPGGYAVRYNIKLLILTIKVTLHDLAAIINRPKA
jgi:hypothetical protein